MGNIHVVEKRMLSLGCLNGQGLNIAPLLPYIYYIHHFSLSRNSRRPFLRNRRVSYRIKDIVSCADAKHTRHPPVQGFRGQLSLEQHISHSRRAAYFTAPYLGTKKLRARLLGCALPLLAINPKRIEMERRRGNNSPCDTSGTKMLRSWERILQIRL